MRQNASKCDDLRKQPTSLNCRDQRLFELFGEKLILLPKLNVASSIPVARCERSQLADRYLANLPASGRATLKALAKRYYQLATIFPSRRSLRMPDCWTNRGISAAQTATALA